MINDFDLTPEEFKQKYPEEIIKNADTFETHGVSKQEAINYLDTPEGELYYKRLREADPVSSIDKIEERAIDHLTTGSDLPRMEIINEPLVKIVPKGQKPSAHSPFWAKESDLNAAIADGKNLSKHFGLPVGSESAEYDIYKITPKTPTEVFVGQLAPTAELEGQIIKSGGAVQYLTPNRNLYSEPTFVKSVDNRVYIPHQKELQIPSDLKNPAIQTIGGLPRVELAAMSDELTSKHGYTPAKALEAVNARVTLHIAVDDFKLGKGLNTSDEVLRSQAIVRQTTTIMGDSVTNAVQVEVMNRQYVAYTSVLNNAPSEVVQANLAAIDKPNTRSIGETPFTQAYKQTLHDPAPLPTTSTKVMDKHISEIKIGEYKNITEFTQNTTVQNTAKQVAKVAELKQLANEPIQMIKLNQITAEVQTLRQGSHLAEEIGGGLGKLAGKAVVGVGLIDGAVSISKQIDAAQQTANSRKEELTKGTGAFTNGIMQETGVDFAISAVDAAYQLNPVRTVERMVSNQTLNPFTGIVDEVQKNAKSREESYTSVGASAGESLYKTFSLEGRSQVQLAALEKQQSESKDPSHRKELQVLIDNTRETYNTAHNENQNRIAGVHGVVNSYDEFITKNPRYREDISKDDVLNETEKFTDQGVRSEQAVSTSYVTLKQKVDHNNAEKLAKLSESDRQAALKIYNDNPGASIAKSIEMVELQQNRGITSPGGAPIGEGFLKAAQANMEQANHKADPNYGKDPNDIRIDQLAAQAKAAHQAQQALFKAVEKLDIDSKIQYYQIKAQQQRKDPNHYAHPHDAASIASHLDTQRRNNARAAQNDKTYTYKESHGQAKSAAPVVHTVVRHRPASPPEMGKGAHGPQVKNLQASLNAAGMHLAVTGRYDKTTIQAVKAFQKEHHLKVDGTIGKKDVKVIGQVIKAQNAHHAIEQLAQLNGHEAPKQAKGLYNLKEGVHNDQVKEVQLALKQLGYELPVDGQYDKATLQAVKAFQKEHHLKVDGKMDGNDVWALAKAVNQQHRVEYSQQAMTQLAQLNGNPEPKQQNAAYNFALGANNGQIQEVQLALKQLGYEVPTDGRFDKSTEHAVKAFQKEQHLKVDGKIDVQDVMAIAAAVSKHQQEIGKEQSVEPSLQKSAVPTQSKNAEQTAMAQGMMNVAQQTQTPNPSVEASKPDLVAQQPQAVAQTAPQPAQTNEPIQLPPRIATLQEQIKGHLTNHPEFGNQIAHLSDKDQQTAIALATYEATHNRAKAVDYVWISPKGEVCMSFDGDKGFSGAMNMNQVQNNDANQVLAASVNLQQTQQHNLAQRQEHSQSSSMKQ